MKKTRSRKSCDTVPLKVPKCEIFMSWILMIFFIMKSIQVGDLRAEIKFVHFYRWVRYWSFCFSYRMRRLRQQIATVWAVYASKVLPNAPHTLAICYRMRRLRQQNRQFYTVLLPHEQCTLANCYRMRRLRQQFATACAAYASKLLPYAPSTLAICNRIHRIHQQSATACAVYTNTRSPSIPQCFSYRMCRLRQQVAILKIFSIPRSLKTTRNNRSSPVWSNQNFFSQKSYYFCITINETVQHSKKILILVYL